MLGDSSGFNQQISGYWIVSWIPGDFTRKYLDLFEILSGFCGRFLRTRYNKIWWISPASGWYICQQTSWMTCFPASETMPSRPSHLAMFVPIDGKSLGVKEVLPVNHTDSIPPGPGAELCRTDIMNAHGDQLAELWLDRWPNLHKRCVCNCICTYTSYTTTKKGWQEIIGNQKGRWQWKIQLKTQKLIQW